MVTPVVAPYVPNYANRAPYLTSAEYLADPNGVDTSLLVPNGSSLQQATALTSLIARASSWADSLAYQVLGATLDTEGGLYRIRGDGTCWVPVRFTPIVQVNGVSWGWTPSTQNAMTDLTDVWIDRARVQIPVLTSSLAGPVASYWPQSIASPIYLTMTYVNGFANTTVPAATSAAATSVVAQSATGIVPGLPMTLTDGLNTETVTVGTGYVNGSTTVPISATVNAYQAGASLSALPPAIKQAGISLTTALIKVRATQAFTMETVGEQPSKSALLEAGGLEDLEIAIDLLEPFKRVR